MPSSARIRKMASVSSALAGSREASGSSSSKIPGRIANTPAKATFCFSPPDKLKVSRLRRSEIFKRASDSSTLFRISLRLKLRFSKPKATSLTTLVPRIWRSGSCSTVPIICEISANFKVDRSLPKAVI